MLDPFAGSNTTGEAAESLGRRWLALERNRDYGSAFRFMTDWPHDDVGQFVAAAQNGAREQLVMSSAQRALF